jgi:hypothetical protein
MSAMIETTGTIGLADEKLVPVSEREPCRFAWAVGPGGWTCEVLSEHDLSPASGALLVAIYDPQDRPMFALPIVGRPVGSAHAMHVGPRPRASGSGPRARDVLLAEGLVERRREPGGVRFYVAAEAPTPPATG